METIEINGNAYQLDVEKAKELGLLKDTKPRSWEEYCNNTKRNTYDYDEFSSREESMAFIAFGKLIQLRDAWYGNWKPDWDENYTKYTIVNVRGSIKLCMGTLNSRVLTFPTKEMRDDFFETFRDLIEEAKMFL